MTLAELIAAVYTETNRPDLVAETLQSVLEATLSCHSVDLFPKDIMEAMVVFDQPTWYVQTLDTDSMPRFRRMAYIKKSNPVVTQVQQTNTLLPGSFLFPAGQFNLLSRIDIRNILDEWGYQKQDVWYQAGSQVNIKSSTPLQFAMAGWYQYPILDPTGALYNSWIANELPYAIIYKAAGSVFGKIGETSSFASYMKMPVPGRGNETGGLYYQQLAILIADNINTGD